MANEKTDHEVEKQRDAVASMKNAQANMKAAIDRIESLELQLRITRDKISRFKNFVSKEVYDYNYGGNQKLCHSVMDEAIADITKTLG